MDSVEAPIEGLKIAEVERRTGVGVHTLRVWERRYGVPRPQRTEGGQRLYSERDVRAIARMRDLARQGFSLAVAARTALREQEYEGRRGEGGPVLLDRFVEALLDFDEPAASEVWSAALASADTPALIGELVTPALVGIGDRWQHGSAGVDQEHFASGFIRGRLEALVRQHTPPPGSPTVLLACVPGELHELPLVMLSLLLRYRGVRAIYLGQDVPEDALLSAATYLNPAAIALHTSTSEFAGLVADIATAVRRETVRAQVVFGGRPFDDEPESQRIVHAIYGGPSVIEGAALIERMCRTPAYGGVW